jgi:hypothetical protein
MNDKKPPDDDKFLEIKIESVHDLSDFCQKWPRLRHLVKDIKTSEETTSKEVDEIFKWLVLLADRVCFRDEYF